MGEKHLNYGAVYWIKPSQYSLIWNPSFHHGTSEANMSSSNPDLYCQYSLYGGWVRHDCFHLETDIHKDVRCYKQKQEDQSNELFTSGEIG